MISPDDRDDTELRELFARLRSADRAKLPRYRAVLEQALARRRFPASRARSLTVRAAAAAVVVAGGVIAYQRLHHDSPRHSAPAASSLASWKSPTGILLHTPGRELLREVPDLNSSILDRITPTTKSEGPGS